MLCDETKTAAREPAKYRFDGIKGMELTDARVRLIKVFTIYRLILRQQNDFRNLFPVDARLTIGLETRQMSYGTSESAGEKAIGQDQDERENWGEGGGANKRTTKKNGCRPTPPPTPLRGFDGA